jgi:hypothetical protein
MSGRSIANDREVASAGATRRHSDRYNELMRLSALSSAHLLRIDSPENQSKLLKFLLKRQRIEWLCEQLRSAPSVSLAESFTFLTDS